jgi:23S rRNA-/tRNA-specific pseudouridylate synthase
MSALGNPIIGDKIYGNIGLNGYFAKNFSMTRQMLHAWKIGFTHPKTGKKMNLEARLKKDMIEFITKLKK